MRTGKQILVVDSDDAVRTDLEEQINELGHDSVTTWSGLEALDLLKLRRFDILLVGDYLPDMYIGDFLEEASLTPSRPKIWVTQAKPLRDTCTYGSRCFSVVGKSQVVQILERLGARIDRDIAGPSGWEH